MDTRTLAAAAGVDIATLNVWLQRSLVSGVKIGRGGKKRIFGGEAALSLFLIAEMTRAGLSAPMASEIAREATDKGAKRLLVTQLPSPSNQRRFRAAYCENDADTLVRLDDLRALAEQAGEPEPVFWFVLNVEAVMNKLQSAQAAWAQAQQQQQAA